jgi:peptide/nickel transport system ATP-binding protein
VRQQPPILDISGLKTWFFTSDGVVKAVDGVDLAVARGEVLGLVGESARASRCSRPCGW